jgi:uncharacterized protein YlxW (UPF0749 family)
VFREIENSGKQLGLEIWRIYFGIFLDVTTPNRKTEGKTKTRVIFISLLYKYINKINISETETLSIGHLRIDARETGILTGNTGK